MAVAHLTRSPRDAAEQLGPAGTLALVLGEWRAMLANNLFHHLPLENLAVPADPPRGLPAEVAVLVVHGYFSNRGILRGVLREVSRRGARRPSTPSTSTACSGPSMNWPNGWPCRWTSSSGQPERKRS